MKILQKIATITAAFAFLLAAPITILAATPTASPTPTVEPTIEPTAVPVVAATPAPQSPLKCVMTHKKISLGVLLVITAAGYGLGRFGRKNKQSAQDKQTGANEEPKEEDQTPSGNGV